MFQGLEGLAATNHLIDVARQQEATDSSCQVVLRDVIYRVALSEQNLDQFQKTAAALPDICEWVDRVDMDASLQLGKDSLGYLRLSNGCKVVHMPSYLTCLWRACDNTERAKWKLVDNDDDLRTCLNEYETVVLAAGSGLFESLLPREIFRIQLVRGQSVFTRKSEADAKRSEAILCGKYVSPLPEKDLLLIGATHEFKEEALTEDKVIAELRERTEAALPYVWNGSVEKITEGYRVQSERGKFGRLPILGKCNDLCNLGGDTWVFTGLSSRGLLYHGLFGELLSKAILAGDDQYKQLVKPI